jgi:hypothetical protein
LGGDIISIIRNILVRVGADITPYQRNMTQAQRSMGSFQNVMRTATANTSLSMRSVANSLTMGRLGLIALGAAAVASFALVSKHAISSAMDAVESESLFSVSMGNMAQSARDWSNQLQESLGLNAYEVRKNVGLFYNMTTSMGLARDQAYGVSTGLTQLAYDMSSFYNQSPDEMFQKLQSGLSGEVEPLKRLGIIVNETTTQNYAYSHGIAAVGTQLSETQKVMARYGAIMEQTKNAQGDLARTIMSPANQLRLLQTQLQMASINLGNAFLPIVTIVLPILTNFAKGLVQVTNTFAQFMSALFGTNNAQAQNAQSASDATAAQKSLGNATKVAGDKAKKSLAGFDQLNLLQESLAANAGDATGALDGGETMPTPAKQDSGSVIPQVIIDMANKAMEALDPLSASFTRLKTALEPFTETMFAGLRWFYDNVLVPFAAWTIEDAIPAFFNALAGAASLLNPLILSFKPLAAWLWEGFLQPIATWTGGAIVSVLNGLWEALAKIGKWMSDNQPIVDGMAKSVVAFMLTWEVVDLLAFIQMSSGVVEALKAITLAVKAGTLAKLADNLETMALTAMYAKDLVVSVAAGTLAFVGHAASVAASTLAQGALTLATGAWNIICGIGTTAVWLFNAALAVLTSPITLVVLAIAGLVAGVYLLVSNWDKVKEVGAAAWEGIKSAWNQAASWFDQHVTTPIKNLFSGLWNGVGSIFKGIANTMIDALNYLIRGLNKIHFDVPDWVPERFGGGQSFGVNIREVPHLAKGGEISSPTLAMMGERNRKEVVLPLEDSSVWDMMASTVGSAVVSALTLTQGNSQQPSGQTMPEYLVLKVGETEFGRVAIKSINSVHRQTGMTLLTV